MGTILESDRPESIFEATRAMMETVHMLGIKRLEVALKIDSRQDKNQTMQDKIDSVRRQL
jgi:uncharacterized protein YqgV (UPF0045/DUF77 family)